MISVEDVIRAVEKYLRYDTAGASRRGSDSVRAALCELIGFIFHEGDCPGHTHAPRAKGGLLRAYGYNLNIAPGYRLNASPGGTADLRSTAGIRLALWLYFDRSMNFEIKLECPR